MRYLINMSYDGSKFYGYQIQKNNKTVEGELERVLSKILNANINTLGASRTDKGVHANNQYCHFDAEKMDLNGLPQTLEIVYRGKPEDAQFPSDENQLDLTRHNADSKG